MLRWLLLAAVVLPTLAPVAAQPPPLEGLDAYVEEGLRTWGIPGLAVAVVRGDSVVFARGYGVRALGAPEPVDEHTLFGVASTTKAMTATLLAMLVEEGRLDWDTRVVDVLPEFRLVDPWVTEQVTVRDLLAHRVGLGRIVGNRLPFLTHRSREEVLYRMRYHTFERPFREGYVYSNVMYAVAGALVPALTGQSWDDALTERLFAPLGMTTANTSITQIADDANAAWPHQEIDGETVRIPRRNFDNVGPAASVNASALDMAQWLRFNLGEPGTIGGRRLVRAETMRALRRPQVVLSGDHPAAGGFTAYGLGWQLGTYRGRPLVRHGGATDGMHTNLVMLPEEDLGVVVLTNTFNDFTTSLANEILDRFLEERDVDWAAETRARYERTYAAARARRAAIEAARIPNAPPTHPLEAYVGRYEEDLYDRVEVFRTEGGLALRLWDDDELVADLEPWHYDTFRAVWRNRALRELFVWFQLGPDGQPAVLNVEFALRPVLAQVGSYPSDYTRVVAFRREGAPPGMASGQYPR